MNGHKAVKGVANSRWNTSLGKAISNLNLVSENPSVEDLVSVLQSCRRNKSLEDAKRVHAHICNTGLEENKTVGNYVVPMFAECGSVLDAHEAFNRLHHRSEHSWTSLILGYIESGQPEHALGIYTTMRQDSVHPSCYTLMALIRACARTNNLERGRQIHNEIKGTEFERDPFIGSTLIGMYAKCGCLPEAQQVFDKLLIRDVVCWTTLIAGYSQDGDDQKALTCFEQMQLEGVPPNTITFIGGLKACASIGAAIKAREIHSEILQKGFERDPTVGSVLVDMYAKCGLLVDAQRVFDTLPFRDIVCWTGLISGYAGQGNGQQALGCFEQMKVEGVRPNAVTFACGLKACANTAAIDKGREIHTEITQNDFGKDPLLAIYLVDMYVKCGSLVEAQEVFDKMPVKDVVSWNMLITGYQENGLSENALCCFEQVQLEGIVADAVTYVGVLKACGSIGAIRKGQQIHIEIAERGFERDTYVGGALIDMYARYGALAEAQAVFDKLLVRNVVCWTSLIGGYAEHEYGQKAVQCYKKMQLEGFAPDAVTFVFGLKACGSIGAIGWGRKIHTEILRKGLGGVLLVGNTLIDMYAKCGSLVEAQNAFDMLLMKNLVSWNTLMSGYVENGFGLEVLKCFEQLQIEGLLPNSVSFVFILKACGSIGALDMGRKMHNQIARMGFQKDFFVGTSLVDMYAKCGSLSEAQVVFDMLPFRDIVSWNAMLRGYGVNYNCGMAMRCFKDMRKQGIIPNAVTFTCLLTACSRASLVLKGQEYFKIMQEEYGIEPIADHYNSMVDLLARSGHLYDAMKLLETSPFIPSKEALISLLSACKTYGDVQLGFGCFEMLSQKNLDSAAFYVLMANIYANAGTGDSASEIEETCRVE